MMMGASATVNHLVATHTMIRVVMMFEMHPRNCTTMPGKTMSMVSVSRLKRLMILPLGVVSKKLMGILKTLVSRLSCIHLQARQRKK